MVPVRDGDPEAVTDGVPDAVLSAVTDGVTDTVAEADWVDVWLGVRVAVGVEDAEKEGGGNVDPIGVTVFEAAGDGDGVALAVLVTDGDPETVADLSAVADEVAKV